MPTYEYKCESCQEEFEEEHSIKDTSPRECPKCKSSNTRKMISRSSFQLKGTGWFKDGY